MIRRVLAAALAAIVCLAANLSADELKLAETDWPWWRGPQHNGIASADQQPPTRWSADENVVWKAGVPGRGHASPTVVGDRVFLPTADEQQMVQYVLCFDRGSGRQLWQTEVHRGPLNFKNEKASQASSTIACDGQRLFVNFLNDGAVYTTALDLSGKRLWQKKVSDYVVHQGYGSSPFLYRSLVIVTADNKQGGAIVAFERASGREVWRQDRPATPNYPSPVVLHADGRDQCLLSGCDMVSSFDPLSGKKLWETAGATTECVTTSVSDGTLVFTSGGYPRNHVSAVHTDGSGKLAWENNTRVYVPSMIVSDGLLFAVADAGIAVCWQCDTGRELWKKRLRGTFSASPVMVGNLIYATNEEGTTFILKPARDDCEIVAQNQLGDQVFATPAICGGRIYYRAAHYDGERRSEALYCLGE